MDALSALAEIETMINGWKRMHHGGIEVGEWATMRLQVIRDRLRELEAEQLKHKEASQ